MVSICGYTGVRLRIDLTNRQVAREEITEDYARKWVGGRGFNMEAFYREIPVDAAPRGPENKLMFAVGPLTGTSLPGSRINVSGKSPHTGYLGDSNAGGHFSAEMKYAGYDQIIFEGKADAPVYIRIVDDQVEIRDAAAIWNLDVWDTQAAIRSECGDHTTQVACCGNAAVNGVSFGCIITNNARAMGRTGMGTLMASKNLKAIAINGSQGVKVAKPDHFQALIDFIFRRIYNHSNFQERGITGTTNLIRLCQVTGILPTRHFQTGVFEHALQVCGETAAINYNVKRKACFGCVNPCSRYYYIPDGFDGRELRAEGPEYETLAGFTSRVGNSDLKLALKCAEVVNRAGVDSITVSEVISWAQELFEKGMLTSKDCDGLNLSWGNSRAVYELLLKIVNNEGFGSLLAQGVVHAAETLGVGRELCMEGKNLELFQADVRGLQAYGLGNAVASRGADHQRADPFFEMSERTAEAKQRFGSENCALMLPWEGKGKMVPWFEEICALADSLNFCKIIGVSMEVVDERVARDLWRFSTGIDVGIEEMLQAGERIVNLERVILARWGLSRKDDYLSKRFLEEPLPQESNLAAGMIFENEQLLNEYYPFRGWDPETGWPTEAKLKELGLEHTLANLATRGIHLKKNYDRFDDDIYGTTTARYRDIGNVIGDSIDYINELKPDASTANLTKKAESGSMNKKLIVDPGLCTGCRACEVGCSFVHEKIYASALARLHVVKLEEIGVDQPITCLRCAKAPCVSICPTQAIAQDPETRIVRVDIEKCVGCEECARVCVSGVIELHPREEYPLLCDLCDGDPECIKKCPTGALTFTEGRGHYARQTRENTGRQTEKQLLKRWRKDSSRPVYNPMTPPDPQTGEPITPPEPYDGDPPQPIGDKKWD